MSPSLIVQAFPSAAEFAAALRSSGSYLDINADNGTTCEGAPLHCADTRDHGDVGEEQPGEADIEHANSIAQKLRAKWPHLRIFVSTVDEWVYLNVTTPS